MTSYSFVIVIRFVSDTRCIANGIGPLKGFQ